MNLARRFNAGLDRRNIRVASRQLKIVQNNGEISRRYATRTTYHALPGVETPGYSHAAATRRGHLIRVL